MGIDMSPEEDSFMRTMDLIAGIRQTWLEAEGSYTADLTIYQVENWLESLLETASYQLKLSPEVARWRVKGWIYAHNLERSLVIQPKNDIACDILRKYQELYAQRELSTGY